MAKGLACVLFRCRSFSSLLASRGWFQSKQKKKLEAAENSHSCV